jgi:hypothetical protein
LALQLTSAPLVNNVGPTDGISKGNLNGATYDARTEGDGRVLAILSAGVLAGRALAATPLLQNQLVTVSIAPAISADALARFICVPIKVRPVGLRPAVVVYDVGRELLDQFLESLAFG